MRVNNMKNQKLELLAPSGDWDSFLTAIGNGADAVYLGLGDFNARAKSTFFNTQNIRKTVEYAHLRGVKVYVTINTLVEDTELSDFIQLVNACISAKVDAYIVQDYGCAYLLHKMFPGIELHASTQMGIHNARGAQIAKKMGFTRVVLSREAKLKDIIEISQLGIEIEYFVQGALCVAFSGNCYFSALNNGQSGNRGKCLQLCRLPYSAYIDNQLLGEGYLLSARDLCMLPRLKELIDAGVISFKIEGRLRRAGYVGQAVRTYRQALDSILENKQIDQALEKQKLRQVFSRGDFNYSAYLDDGVPENVINPRHQNHLGLKIGTVKSIEKFKDLYRVGIQTNHGIKSGDGLKFLDNNEKEVDSLGVGNVERSNGLYYIFTKHRLTPNLTVYLTLDTSLEQSVTSIVKKVRVNIDFTAQVGQPIVINACTNEGKSQISYQSDYICTMAKTSPVSKEEVQEIFNNLDLEDFEVTVASINLGNVFIPKSALKEARRIIAPALRQQIITDYESCLPNITEKYSLDSLDFAPQIFSKYNDIYLVNEQSDLDKFSIKDNDLVILSPIDYETSKVIDFFNNLSAQYDNVGFSLPTIASGQDCAKLDEILSKLPHSTPLLVNNAYGLCYADSYYLIAGTDMNIYNKFSILSLQNLGVKEFVWSKEIAKPSYIDNVYEYAYGHQVLMYFCHCPYKTIWNNTCQNCHYQAGLTLLDQAGKNYRILRHKITQCYFTLTSSILTQKENIKKKFFDIRN